MNRTLDPSSEFYLDKTLQGHAMREQLTEFYNKLGYWSEQASRYDAERKTLQAIFDRAKDEAKAARAIKAKSEALKASAQDAFIRNFWNEKVDLDGEVLTPAEIQNQLRVAVASDNEARHNMNVCQYAVDICRSLLSWDKQELSRMES